VGQKAFTLFLVLQEKADSRPTQMEFLKSFWEEKIIGKQHRTADIIYHVLGGHKKPLPIVARGEKANAF